MVLAPTAVSAAKIVPVWAPLSGTSTSRTVAQTVSVMALSGARLANDGRTDRTTR